jgi:hypothetical protein
MSTLTVTIASDNIAFLGAMKADDPTTTMTLAQVESIAVVYDINDDALYSLDEESDYSSLSITASAILRANAASFEAQMKTTVASLISSLNRPNYELANSVAREYEEKAIAIVAKYAEMVKGSEDRWVTVVISSEGELLDAYADNDRTLMPGQSNSTLVTRSEEEEEADYFEEIHNTLEQDYGWKREAMTVAEAGQVIPTLEDWIEFEADENRTARRENKPEEFNPPIMVITLQAYRALSQGAGIAFGEDNYDYTFTLIDYPTCAIYITDREAMWDKEETNDFTEIKHRFKKYGKYCVIDDDNSQLIPVFIPGEKFKVIEITDWDDTPPAPYAYSLPAFDLLEEAPF